MRFIGIYKDLLKFIEIQKVCKIYRVIFPSSGTVMFSRLWQEGMSTDTETASPITHPLLGTD